MERPIIRIAPRSKPITPAIEGNGGGADSAAARRAAIFGAAKPVDIVAREKDLEKVSSKRFFKNSGSLSLPSETPFYTLAPIVMGPMFWAMTTDVLAG